MNKSIILFVVAISVTASLGSCTFKKEKPVTEPLQNQQNGQVQPTGSGESQMEMIDTNSWSLVGFNGPTWSGSDIAMSAVNSGDLEKCKKLAKEFREDCTNSVRHNSAILKTDYKDCSAITDSKLEKSCEAEVSKLLLELSKTPSDCSKIKDNAIKSTCQNRISILANPKSEDDCKKLTNPKDQKTCVQMVLMNSVRQGNSTSSASCENISEPAAKKECLAYVEKNKVASQKLSGANVSSPVQAQILKTCAEETGANEFVCLKKGAVESGLKTGDTSACSLIKDSSFKSSCVSEINTGMSQQYFMQAMDAKNPSLCDKISEAAKRDACKKIVSAK